MYAVIMRDSLPTVISKNSRLFCEFISAGYKIIFEGCRKDANNFYEEMIVELCQEM
jgi:hypothetical protein